MYPQYIIFVGRMSLVDLDSRGRITLPSSIRKKMVSTKKVVVIEAGDHIKIIPIPKDPFAALAGVLSLGKDASDLRKEIEIEVIKEAGKGSNRRD